MKARFVVPGRLTDDHAAQLAIAVFDDWSTLQVVLDDIVTSCGAKPSLIVLSRDMPSVPDGLRLSRDVIRMCFARPGLYATCSRGKIADELALRLAHRPHTLAHALRQWLPLDQAWRLESYIEQGHVVLLLELPDNENLGTVCAKLIHHSPHIVRLSQISIHVGN